MDTGYINFSAAVKTNSVKYTNRHKAQGYTKYSPIRELFDDIYEVDSTVLIPETRIAILNINEELVRDLAKYPEMLYELDPRKFEELVAHILQNKGFDITLTPKTRDGGRDIQAVHKSSLGNMLYLIECKRYQSSNKVRVELVRSLYGVKQRERATMGILVTTSSFTKDALDFASPLKYELSLRDYETLKKWLKDYK
ncbi:restriction endonuclease [Nostoc sp. DedQUE09]|uniref:restriction endonuclease n=1 Tax=Nostoc sp. DedQUE09 TaxID=3075394 RepID=UPI002AD2B814|nr:restriction endonuclease [Nostoc sp. DedQUE09]MDZ7950286.1 restriction endonuclease [Nostoc sp. DedQUE09]